MPVPATTGQLRTRIEDMDIGDYIPCHYRNPANNVAGHFYGIGKQLTAEIPEISSAVSNGMFYLVKTNRGILVADRVVQHSITWDTLNLYRYIDPAGMRKGIQFNGVNAYMGIAYTALLAPSTFMSAKLVVTKSSWAGRSEYWMSKFQNGGYAINYQTDRKIRFAIRTTTSVETVVFADASDFEDGSTHTVIATYDGRYARIYVDGKLKDTGDSGSAKNIYYNSSNGLTVGCEVNTGSGPDTSYPLYAEATIQEFAFWNRTITEEEAAIYSDELLVGNEAGLVGLWNLASLSGSTVYNMAPTAAPNGGVVNGVIELDNSIKVKSIVGGIAFADVDGKKTLTDEGFGGWPMNNEWDKHVVNFPTNKIQSGKTLDDVFHWKNIYTWCQDTTATGIGSSAVRTMRGNLEDKTFGYGTSSVFNNLVGFRPVFEYKE